MWDFAVLARPVVWIIGGYKRLISPLLVPRCRFYPSCSTYAKEALLQHGLFRGGWYTAKRLVKCHPFHPGGIDEVPPKKELSYAHH